MREVSRDANLVAAVGLQRKRLDSTKFTPGVVRARLRPGVCRGAAPEGPASSCRSAAPASRLARVLSCRGGSVMPRRGEDMCQQLLVQLRLMS